MILASTWFRTSNVYSSCVRYYIGRKITLFSGLKVVQDKESGTVTMPVDASVKPVKATEDDDCVDQQL